MRIGYVLKKFPRFSETFILNEILELERQGVEVEIFSVQPPDDGVLQPGLSRLRAPVRYLTNVKGEALRSGLREHLELLRNHREGLFRAFEGELVEGRTGLSTTIRAGLTVAVEARRFQLDRLHAHFATVAARVARVAHLTSGIPWPRRRPGFLARRSG